MLNLRHVEFAHTAFFAGGLGSMHDTVRASQTVVYTYVFMT